MARLSGGLTGILPRLKKVGSHGNLSRLSHYMLVTLARSADYSSCSALHKLGECASISKPYRNVFS